MKLPDFMHFEPLIQLKKKMGIAADVVGDLSVIVERGRLTEVELDKLASGEGLEIAISDLRVLPDGTLAYKDTRVLLYIRDVTSYGRGSSEPRYHLSDCTTLREMRANGRFSVRYVVSTRSDGLFNLNVLDGSRRQSQLTPLTVCQNCLGKIRFNGFRQDWGRSQRQAAVRSFLLNEFFTQYPTSLHHHRPKHTDETSPINVYSNDFEEIGRRLKAAVGYKCQECWVDLSASEHQQYLHAHHINGAKYQSDPSNLKIVCLFCHANSPMHAHMKRGDYWQFVSLRRSLLQLRK